MLANEPFFFVASSDNDDGNEWRPCTFLSNVDSKGSVKLRWSPMVTMMIRSDAANDSRAPNISPE